MWFHSWKQEQIKMGQIRRWMSVEDCSHICSGQKLLRQSTVCWYSVMLDQPVMVPPQLWTLLPQVLQNFTVVMMINHMDWRNILLTNHTHTVKNNHPNALDVWLDLPHFLQLFSYDRTGVSFLDHYSESRFCFLCFWYGCPDSEAKLQANVLFLQINHELHFSCTMINNRSEAVQVMVAKVRLRIAILRYLLSESCATCCSWS